MKFWYKVPAAILVFALLTGIAIAGNFDSDIPHRQGVLIFSLDRETKIDIPEAGAERLGIDQIDQFLDQINATWAERSFPHCLPSKSKAGDLATLYNLYFPETFSVVDVCKDMGKIGGVEFAEPWWLYKAFIEHNDSYRDDQYYLDLIEANDAHDISTGDPDAVIGIVDSGVDMDHSDLVDNLWVNPGEDLNGDGEIQQNERNREDDDRNGKVDDFYGWDFYGDDNNPDDTYGHGTHCAGIACAVTNNRRGIASPGYECSIMSVRAGGGVTITHGYQGIEYAVRSGAHVVSLSWGGEGRSQWTDRVVEYAHENDVLLVAAAGNDNRDGNFYPARYESLICVAATDNRDNKANFSNYGEWVDISAPGVQILSTVPGGRYAYLNGTSMACPLAAGVAILLRAAYPHMSGDEIFELITDGADDIENNLAQRHRGMMGAGRVNAYESIILGARPMLTVEDFEITVDDNDNGKMDPGERVDVVLTLSNGEEAVEAEDIIATLESEDEDIFIETHLVQFPNIEPGEEFSNEEEPFEIEINEDAIPHTSWMTLTITAEPANVNIEKTVEVIIGHPSILLVDDDEGEDSERYYYDAIEELDMGWVRWDVELDFAPDIVTLTDYDLVIWNTGRSIEPLDDLDRFQLEAGLETGANILLVGKRIGDFEENHSILRTYFGAEHEQDSVRAMTVRGLAGNRPVGDDIQMLLFGAGEAGDGRSTPSTMSTVRDADSLMVYELGDDAVGLAGVYREDERIGNKTAYIGFAFEAINDRIVPKSQALSGIYDWFMGNLDSPFDVDIQPVRYALSPAFPNPFNGTVKMSFSLPERGRHRLSIYSIDGKEIQTLSQGVHNSGIYAVTWDALDVPAGLYFARLTVPGQASIEQKLILTK